MANEDESTLKTVAEKIGLGGKGGKAPEYGEADRNGYVGVSPEYANAANDTDLPLEASDYDEDAWPEEESTTTSAGTTSAPASTQTSTSNSTTGNSGTNTSSSAQ